jgi:hypothetical protein
VKLFARKAELNVALMEAPDEYQAAKTFTKYDYCMSFRNLRPKRIQGWMA